MRAIYSGIITYGLITLNVKLYNCQKQNAISFNNLCPCGNKLKYKYYCDKENRFVESSEIKKGFRISKDLGYVIFDKEELEAIKPKSSKVIEISNFCSIEDIDPIYFDKFYYVIPEKENEKAYFLLKEALSLSNKIAIAKITMRNKEHLCVLKPYKNLIVLITLYDKEDIVNGEEILEENDIKKPILNKEEVDYAIKFIEVKNEDFQKIMENHKDGFREMVKEFIKAKAENKFFKPITVKEQVETPNSLVEALKVSIEKAKKKNS
jgi:DNA end-binding protein Ku